MPETPAKPRKIKLNVRDFAVPAPRSGSIDADSGYGPVPERGLELHAKIQDRAVAEHDGYRPEVALAETFVHAGYEVRVTGRADGIYEGAGPVVIEEIKSSYDASGLKSALAADPYHPYALQLRTYGYFYFLKKLVEPKLRLLLVCARTEQQEVLEVELARSDYEAWLERRLEELAQEEKVFAKMRARRRKLGLALSFPFDALRTGQAELVETVATVLKSKTELLLQAPTGLGKTAGIIYPTAKEALTRGHQLVYVTPKNSQQQVAEEAAAHFRAKGHEIRALTVTAKGKICMKDEPLCNSRYCEYAKDYYTKVAEHGLGEKLRKRRTLDARYLRKLAHEYKVCPFQLSMDASRYPDLVICDYNYVIAPSSGLCHALTEARAPSNSPSLVIDEAHNLPSRASEYYSSQLSEAELLALGERVAGMEGPLAKEGTELVADCVTALRKLRGRDATSLVTAEQLEPIAELDDHVKAYLARYLAQAPAFTEQDPVLAWAFYFGAFREAAANLGENFFVTSEVTAAGVRLKITCCDASPFLSESWKRFRKIVAFSATIKPFEYYAKLSGFAVEDLATAEFASPFPKERRKLLVIPQVSTALKAREKNYDRIAEVIERIALVRPGNYAAFFPSYGFLREVAARLEKRGLGAQGFDLKLQSNAMKKGEIEDCLDSLKGATRPALLMAVQGGAFAEGVDYRGDMLIGAFVVGPAIPTFDLERRLLAKYYEEQYGQGSDFAYTYPAMAKAVQAAGRVIRSPEDKGVIVLLDQRFVEPRYARVMPSDWFEANVQELVSKSILRDVREFWESP